jgi:hypothetical protein
VSHAPAGLLAVTLFAGTGWALTALVPALRKLRRAERLGHAYLLGLAWICTALYALSHLLGVRLRLSTTLAVAAVPVAAAAVTRLAGGRAEGPGSLSPGQRLGWGGRTALPRIAAVAFAAVVSLALFADALGTPPADWDGRMTWGAQARWLFAAGTVDPPVLLEKPWSVSHPQYPLLLPIAQGVALEIQGAADDDRAARPLYAAFFPALLAILYGRCRRWLGARTAAWVLLAAANIPLLSFAGEAGARSGYSDLPLACFYGTGLLLLLSRPRLPEGLAAGLLLAAAVLAKNEGLPLALAALLLGAATALRRRTGRRAAVPVAAALLAVAVVVAAIGLLQSWRSQIPNREDEGYAALAARAGVRRLAADLLPHAKIAAPLAVDRMLAREHWGLFWPAALALAAAGARGLRRPPALRLALAAAAPVAVGLLAYTVHPDPARLIAVTWNRMLLHGILPLLLLFGMALRAVLATALGSRASGVAPPPE